MRIIGKLTTITGTIEALTNLSTQDRILGQYSSTGDVGYISVGSGLSLSSGTLTATGGGSSLFPTSGTGTATASVTGDLDGNDFVVSNINEASISTASATRLSLSTSSSMITSPDGSSMYAIVSDSIAQIGNATTTIQTYASNRIDVITSGNIRIQDTTLASASVGDVWTLANDSNGQSGWAAPVGFSNPMTTAGDIILGGASGAPTRLGIGANTYVLTSNGTTASWAAPSGGSGTPGGSNTQIQYNNSGSFGGVSGATSSGTNITFGSGNLIATRPKFITSLDDTNGNEEIIFTATASAVNELTITNAATGNSPALNSSGGDTNVSLSFGTKGTGDMIFSTNSLERLKLDGSSATGKAKIFFGGSAAFMDYGVDAANNFTFSSAGIQLKTTSAQSFYSNSNLTLVVYNGEVAVGSATAVTGTRRFAIYGQDTTHAAINFVATTLKTTPISGDLDRDANRLRYTNATAVPQFVELTQRSRVTSQFDKTDTSLANVTGLTANVAASSTYTFEIVIYGTCDTTGGMQIAIGGTATATSIVYQGFFGEGGALNNISSRATAMATGVAVGSGSTSPYVVFTGTIVVNAAGTLTVQMAEEVATGTASILVNSHFKVTQIN